MKTTHVFPSRAVFTRSKAVEHARGWVATKMGLSDIINPAARIDKNVIDEQARKTICPNGVDDV